MSDKSLDYYRSLPYTRRVEVREDEESGEVYYVAWLDEIPSLRIDGDTREEALGKLNECFDEFVAVMLEHDDHVPEPDQWPENVGVGLDRKPTPLGGERLTDEADTESEAETSEWSSDHEEPVLV